MHRSMTKRELIGELTAACGVSRTQVAAVLDNLVAIACREARDGFRIPGLCKLSVVHRKARRGRNPATGEPLLIGAHNALKITALKRVRDAVVPRDDSYVTPASPGSPSSASEGAGPASPPTEEAFITFSCPSCRAEIEASRDMAGTQSQCPSCGMPMTIPNQSQPAEIDGVPIPVADLKSKTIRIELPEDL